MQEGEEPRAPRLAILATDAPLTTLGKRACKVFKIFNFNSNKNAQLTINFTLLQEMQICGLLR